MSKKLTFKSVAISAVIALGMTGIVGVSASAAPAGTVTLAPTTGTEYFVTSSQNAEFSLTSTNSTEAIGSTGLLKWKITAATAADEQVKVKTSTLGSLTPVGTKQTATNVVDENLGGSAGVWYQNDNTVSLFLADASSKVAAGSEIRVLRYTSTRVGDNADDADDVTTQRYAADVTSDATATETVRVVSVSNGLVTYQTSFPQDTVSSNAPGNQSSGSSARWGTYYEIDFGNATNNTYASGVMYVNSRHNAASFNKTLVLSQTENVTTTKTVEVTAWIDVNNNGLIDADTEAVSAPRTVTFINPTAVALDATAGFTFGGVQIGQTTATSSIKTNPVLNRNQSTLVPRTLFTSLRNSASVLESPTQFWGGSVRATDTSVITSTSAGQTAFVAGIYTGRPYLTANTSADGTNTFGTYATTYPLGAAVSTNVAADRVYDIIASVAGSANTSPVDTYGGDTSSVRLGTAAVTVSALAVTDGDDTPAGAGKTVVATIDSASFKINGGNGPVTLTTDASGKVSVSITKTTPATAGAVTVTFTSTDQSSTVASAVTLDWVAASYELFNLNDSSQGIDGNLSIAANQSTSFAFAAHDQWKVPAPTASYRVVIDLFGSGFAEEVVARKLAWSGNTANLTVASNGTVGAGVMNVDVYLEKLTGSTWAIEGDEREISIDVVSATQSFKPVLDDTRLKDDIQHTLQVRNWDPRTSQLAEPNYDEDNYVHIGGYVREAVTGLIRPFSKVSISGPADFMFEEVTNTNSVHRLGSLNAVADSNGYFDFDVFSNRSVTDAVVRISVDGGASIEVKITFSAPEQIWTDDIKFTAPKSIKAGRSLNGTVSAVDKWGNVVKEDDDVGDQAFSFSSSRGFAAISAPTENGLTTFSFRVLLQPLDRGPVVLNFAFGTSDSGNSNASVIYSGSTAVWSGPAVNATAGAKKGRVIVEAYRAVGKTVDVFVGSTKVATFTPDVANDRFVVRGVKSGTRNVSVRIVGPGYDFPRTAITVK